MHPAAWTIWVIFAAAGATPGAAPAATPGATPSATPGADDVFVEHRVREAAALIHVPDDAVSLG